MANDRIFLRYESICRHGVWVSQTQCKACLNDEVITLRSKLDSARNEIADLKAQVKRRGKRIHELRRKDARRHEQLATLSSRLDEILATLRQWRDNRRID